MNQFDQLFFEIFRLKQKTTRLCKLVKKETRTLRCLDMSIS